MLRELVFSSFKLFILILVGNFFLKGQEPKSFLNVPFQICWELPERSAIPIASDNVSKIFIPLSDGIIKTIDINRNEVWKTDVGGEILDHLLHQNRTLYVTSKVSVVPVKHTAAPQDNTYSILALETSSGISKWKKEFRSEKIPLLSLQSDRLVVILAENTSSLGKSSSSFNVLDINTGDTIFEKSFVFDVKQFFSTSDGNSENIVILTSLNSIISFSVLDGKTVRYYTSLKGIQTGATSNTGILLSNDRGSIYLLSSIGEEIKFRIKFGARVTSITHQKDSILISSLDNFIYSVSSDGKRINWKRRFPGRVIERPIITPDTIITYSQGDNSLYFLNYNNGKVFNQVTVADKEEIFGSPILLKNFVIVATSRGIKAFSSGSCPSVAATEK
jgi:hypothetical protein